MRTGSVVPGRNRRIHRSRVDRGPARKDPPRSHRPLPWLYSSAVSVREPKRGTVVRGVISEIHNFGVFVRLEGEPTSSRGTGFIRIPELTWDYFSDPEDVVHAGEQIRARCSTAMTLVDRCSCR